MQNALLSIHRGRRSYRPERPFVPWMRAIVRNSIVDHFRDRKRRGHREVELFEERWADDRSRDPGVTDGAGPRAGRGAGRAARRTARGRHADPGRGAFGGRGRAAPGVSVGALKVRAHRGYRALRGRWKACARTANGALRSRDPRSLPERRSPDDASDRSIDFGAGRRPRSGSPAAAAAPGLLGRALGLGGDARRGVADAETSRAPPGCSPTRSISRASPV